MSTSFPTSLDALTNPASTDAMDAAGVEHDIQHADANDAIEALEAKVGVDGSAVATSHDYKITKIVTKLDEHLNHPIVESLAFSDDFDGSSLDGKWGWVNQGSAAVAVAGGRLLLSQASHNATDDIKMIVQSAPGGTWKVRMRVCLEWELETGAYPFAGLCLYESGTGKIEMIGINYRAGTNYLQHFRYTNTSTYTSSGWSNTRFPYGIYYFQVEKTATNLVWSISTDGAYFHQVLSEAIASFFTTGPDQIGLALNSYNCGAVESIASCDWIRRIS
jgi:hypothetical protein